MRTTTTTRRARCWVVTAGVPPAPPATPQPRRRTTSHCAERAASSPSRFTARHGRIPEVSPERFAIVHNGVDLGRFAPADEPRRAACGAHSACRSTASSSSTLGASTPTKASIARSRRRGCSTRGIPPGPRRRAQPRQFPRRRGRARAYADDLRARYPSSGHVAGADPGRLAWSRPRTRRSSPASSTSRSAWSCSRRWRAGSRSSRAPRGDSRRSSPAGWRRTWCPGRAGRVRPAAPRDARLADQQSGARAARP